PPKRSACSGWRRPFQPSRGANWTLLRPSRSAPVSQTGAGSIGPSFPLDEPVAVARVQIEVENLLERTNLAQCLRAEGRLALERVQDDPLEQIPQGHPVQIRDRLEDAQDAPLHPDAGLHP